MNIEKELCPDANILITNEGEATAIILDEEMDELSCTFNNDGCVTIDVSGWSYVVLSRTNLRVLERLIDEAEDYYGELSDEEDVI